VLYSVYVHARLGAARQDRRSRWTTLGIGNASWHRCDVAAPFIMIQDQGELLPQIGTPPDEEIPLNPEPGIPLAEDARSRLETRASPTTMLAYRSLSGDVLTLVIGARDSGAVRCLMAKRAPRRYRTWYSGTARSGSGGTCG
jgi:hypothetical protein